MTQYSVNCDLKQMMLNENTAYDNYPNSYEEAIKKFSRPFMKMFDAFIAKETPGVGTFLLKFIAVGFLSEWAYKNARERLYQSLTTIAINNN